MVAPIDLPVVLSQLPNVQKVQNAGQSGPEMAQAALAQEVVEKQRQESSQVPKISENELDPDCKDEEKKKQETAHQPGSRKKNKKNKSDENRKPEGLLDIRV